MADTNAGAVEFELVSPAKLLVSEPVEMVVVPGAEGDIGVLPGHSPLIATVRPGIIDIHEGGKVRDRIFVGGGFAVVVLAVSLDVLALSALLALLALPLAVRPIRVVTTETAGPPLIQALGDTARLQILVAVLLSIGILLGG